jgi:NTE family protein
MAFPSLGALGGNLEMRRRFVNIELYGRFMNQTRLAQDTLRWSHAFSLKMISAVLVAITSVTGILAQDTPATPKRLKIGVALEGGGALGMAHIGVLRWFEAHRIPIDYIAGTSMGGLVGGLYATGHSPDQIEKLVKQMDWPFVIGGDTPFDDLTFRRKEDARAIPTSIDIGFKRGISLASGLNAGAQISLVIDHEILPYSMVKSFDDLPIPFRCVSTDLISGKPHVFSQGPIGLAMRSTMSFPGIFAPVRNGEEMYVDGALVDNLPTDLVRSMGPDVVIAIHLETSPTTVAELQSLFSVLGRSIEVGIAASELKGMEGADIVVKVDVSKYSSMDYDKSTALIEQGKLAIEAKEKILRPYEVSQAEWDEYIANRVAREKTFSAAPQFVTVVGTDAHAVKSIETQLQPMVDKPLDTSAMDRQFTRLTGTGKYDSVSYRLVEENGKVGLLVDAHERGYAPPVLQIGAEIDGSQTDDVNFTLAGRLTFIDIAGYGSELRSDFSFGNTYGIDTELYKRFSSTSKYFYAPRILASDAAVSIYSYNNPVAEYSLRQAGVGFDLGYAVSRFSEVRTGYQIGYTDAYLKLGNPLFSTFSGRSGSTRFRYQTVHLDDPIIPHRGYAADLNFHWFDTSPGAPAPFPLVQLNAEFFQPLSPRDSIFLLTQGGSTITTSKTGIPQFFSGGTPGWLAYGANELRGDQYYLFRPGYLHRLLPLPPFIGTNVYAIAMADAGKMFHAPGVTKFPFDGAAGIIANTAIGPLFIGGSIGDAGHQKWFFSLGRVF